MQTPEAVTQALRLIQDKLKHQGASVATAESCTGGLLAYLFTELVGSSVIYLGGVSAYADAAKIELLGIDPEDLKRFGAVSAPVAAAMATGIRTRLGSTYALSLTGIAGPGGGSTAKPVGTVFCALSSVEAIKVYPLALSGDRHGVRWAAAVAALRYLHEALA